jgi:hypothetical protein
MRIKPSTPQTPRQKTTSRNQAAESTTFTAPAKAAGSAVAIADSFEKAGQSRFGELAGSTAKRDMTDLASKIDAGKLQNLKQKIDGVGQAAVGRGQWGAFKSLGAKAGAKGGILGQLKEQTASGKKQEMIFGSPSSQISTTGRGGRTSDGMDTAVSTAGGAAAAAQTAGAMGALPVTAVVGGGGAGAAAIGTAAAGVVGAFAAGWGIGKAANWLGEATAGLLDPVYQAVGDAIFEKRHGSPTAPDTTPTPDSNGGRTTTILTPEQIRGITAILGSLVEPADGASGGSGGPVNGGATPGGLLQALAEFADGQVPGGGTPITSENLRGIEARLNQLINRVETVKVES